VGAWLFGSTGRANSQTPVASNLRIQTSKQGRPRAVGWGQARLAGNVIWAGDFVAAQIPQQGGKGGGLNGKNGTGQYNYFASVMLSLCEGPISNILTIFNGSAVDFLVTPPAATIAQLAVLGITPSYGASIYNCTTLLGGYAQSAWSYLASAHPSQSLNYRGQALACFQSIPLGSSPTIPNFNFEVLFSTNSDIPALGPDANPADVIGDMLTNTHYGVGMPSAVVDSFTSYRNFCRAMGFMVSPVLTDSVEAGSFLTDLTKATNSEFVWSGGLLQIIPRGDAAITANGYTYTPSNTAVYDIGVNDYLPNKGSQGTASSISISIRDPIEIKNRTQLEYLDRNNLYNPATVYSHDDADVLLSGAIRLGDLVQAHFFCLQSAAATAVDLLLRVEKIAVNYQFTLPAPFILLDPMDIVTLTEPALGFSKLPVRIIEITENDDMTLTFVAESFPGTISSTAYQREVNLGAGRNNNQDPGALNMPIIFEPPDQLAGGLAVWVGVSGVNTALWGGCFVWASYDDATYTLIETINGPARMGVLASSFASVSSAPSGQTIDSTNTMAVDLRESAGTLLSGTAADMTGLNTACYVDGEIVAYQNASLTGANQYNLTTFVRGAYGTTIASHASGKAFLRLDNSVAQIPYTQDRIGSTIYLKFQPFNIWGGGAPSLATVGAYPYTLTGAALSSPLPVPTNLRTKFNAGFLEIWWDEIEDFRNGIRYQISKGTTYATSIPLGTFAHPPFIVFGDATYWITGIVQPVAGLVVTSGSPASITISGNVLTANVLATIDEQANGWKGTFENGFGVDGAYLPL